MVSQVAVDGGVWGVGSAESVVSSGGLGINMKKCLYKEVILSIALYGAETKGMRSAERKGVNVLEINCLKVW